MEHEGSLRVHKSSPQEYQINFREQQI